MAAMASTITGVRSAKHTSCLPPISSVSILDVLKFQVFCGLDMLDVGFTATLK